MPSPGSARQDTSKSITDPHPLPADRDAVSNIAYQADDLGHTCDNVVPQDGNARVELRRKEVSKSCEESERPAEGSAVRQVRVIELEVRLEVVDEPLGHERLSKHVGEIAALGRIDVDVRSLRPPG
jgi:hypothetical protein